MPTHRRVATRIDPTGSERDRQFGAAVWPGRAHTGQTASMASVSSSKVRSRRTPRVAVLWTDDLKADRHAVGGEPGTNRSGR